MLSHAIITPVKMSKNVFIGGFYSLAILQRFDSRILLWLMTTVMVVIGMSFDVDA